jgi:hypothetical protein
MILFIYRHDNCRDSFLEEALDILSNPVTHIDKRHDSASTPLHRLHRIPIIKARTRRLLPSRSASHGKYEGELHRMRNRAVVTRRRRFCVARNVVCLDASIAADCSGNDMI